MDRLGSLVSPIPAAADCVSQIFVAKYNLQFTVIHRFLLQTVATGPGLNGIGSGLNNSVLLRTN